jgi:hypothetical protein
MNENLNENKKSLTKTDSLIYNFLETNFQNEEKKDEIVDSTDLSKEKSGVEDFLVWFDNNLDGKINTLKQTKDYNNEKNLENYSTVKEASKFQIIVKQNVACLSNLICINNKKLIKVSNDFYTKYQNTKKNFKPILENWCSTFKYEINQIKTYSNWPLSNYLNLKINNRLKQGDDNIDVSYSNFENPSKTDNNIEISKENVTFKIIKFSK